MINLLVHLEHPSDHIDRVVPKDNTANYNISRRIFI